MVRNGDQCGGQMVGLRLRQHTMICLSKGLVLCLSERASDRRYLILTRHHLEDVVSRHR